MQPIWTIDREVTQRRRSTLRSRDGKTKPVLGSSIGRRDLQRDVYVLLCISAEPDGRESPEAELVDHAVAAVGTQAVSEMHWMVASLGVALQSLETAGIFVDMWPRWC
jgi:hypothetical protein